MADLAQLSPTTVSMALRNHENIPAETRERVLNAATQLGYQYAPRASAKRAEAVDPIHIR